MRRPGIRVGVVRQLLRYPVKSMAGTPLESALLGWHGLAGDRRCALRRVGDDSGFPWLSASQLPELLLYHPCGTDDRSGEPRPTHVRTPDGQTLELRGEALRREIAERLGSAVEVMTLRGGTFDDGCLSLIGLATIAAVAREAGIAPDVRRFRPNVVLDAGDAGPFGESGWIGGTLVFGDGEPTAAVSVTADDIRCMIINLDPDTARQDPGVLRTVVRRNGNRAGVYGTALRTGTIHVGQAVWLRPGEG